MDGIYALCRIMVFSRWSCDILLSCRYPFFPRTAALRRPGRGFSGPWQSGVFRV